MYDDADYAGSRLVGTIIRLMDKRPVTVERCSYTDNRKIQVDYTYLSTNRNGPTVMLDSMDLTPVPLGWAENNYLGAAYLARIPKASDYRQGLRMSNYSSVFGTDKRYISQHNLSRTILGKYMSFELTMDEADNIGKVVPFCREFAIRPSEGKADFGLYFKWFGVVGDVVNGRPQLHPNFDHLQETLEGSF